MAQAEEAGLKTLPVANANGDPGKQITDFHNLIAQEPRASSSCRPTAMRSRRR